jgi:hypothetical protein
MHERPDDFHRAPSSRIAWKGRDARARKPDALEERLERRRLLGKRHLSQHCDPGSVQRGEGVGLARVGREVDVRHDSVRIELGDDGEAGHWDEARGGFQAKGSEGPVGETE